MNHTTNTKRTINPIAAAITLAAALLPFTAANAQEMVRPESLPQGFIVIVEDLSKSANQSRPIYFASGLNAWDPGDPEFRLEPRSDTRWQYVFEGNQLGENVEFKFTLGGWATVETDAEGGEIANRKFPAVDTSTFNPGEPPIIEITIPRFRDGAVGFVIAEPYRPLNVTGTVKRLEMAGGVGSSMGKMRDALVWLPPEYDSNPDKTYPVIYMMDGQNIFTNHSGIPAEWGMDETADAMIRAGEIEPVIIVGIPNGGASRTTEYLPPKPDGTRARWGNSTGMGEEHIQWLKTWVMPRVESAFRVKTGPENTAIGGASLGGLIALYAGIMHDDTFGHVLAESPALIFGDYDFRPYLRSNPDLPTGKIFLGMGTDEEIANSFYDGDRRTHVQVIRSITRAMMDTADVELVVTPNATHTESAWAERLPTALRHLYGTGN